MHGPLRAIRPTRAIRPFVLAVAIATAIALAGPSAASASGDITPAPSDLPQSPTVDITPHVLDLTFPVAEPETDTRFIDDFLHLRGGGTRLHAATDIMAPKHRPIHAAMGGYITFAPYPEPSYGWMISIMGDDGYRYAYVHLNNDTPRCGASGRWVDDDTGGVEHAYAPRIVDAIRDEGTARGLRIERGELIGWNGDSGNAKGVAPHLHLEIHVPPTDEHDGYRINPYHSLKDALERGDVPDGDAKVDDRHFRDVDPKAEHGESIGRLAEEGIVRGVDTDRYCPGMSMTRGDLAVSIAAVKGLSTTASQTTDFPDVSPDDPRVAAIATVNDVGILHGYADGTFGPDDPLTRAQLASMLVRTFELPVASSSPGFSDVTDGRPHADAIAATYEAGLTKGCEDGSRYCGRVAVNRAQLASFLDRGRAFDG